MKSLLLATCLLLTVSAIHGDLIDTYLEKMKDVVLKCGKENGFTHHTPRQIFDENQKAGIDKDTCVRACVLKSLGMMKGSKLNSETMKEFVKDVHSDQPEVIKASEKIVDVCVDKVKDMPDKCKMAFAYIECYLDKYQT